MAKADSTLITLRGETHCVAEWSRILGIPTHVLYRRVKTNRTSEAEFTAPPREMHGLSTSHRAEWSVWKGIHKRCSNPADIGFRHYGGRGIKVCERWHSFANFLDDMGCRPSNRHTIEREDNDGDYTPENCVWLLRKFQNRNKRNSHRLTLNGTTKTVAEWAEVTGIKAFTIYGRISLGWTAEQALTAPEHSTRGNRTLAASREDIVAMYSEGQSIQDICKHFDACDEAVRRVLLKAKVTLRTRAEVTAKHWKHHRKST